MGDLLKQFPMTAALVLFLTAPAIADDSADTSQLKMLGDVMSNNSRNHIVLKFLAKPNALCKISLTPADAAREKDLKDKFADKDGNVSWTLHIRRSFADRELPITVRSSHDGQEDRLDARLPLPAIASGIVVDVM
jgi:hypothetical protein